MGKFYAILFYSKFSKAIFGEFAFQAVFWSPCDFGRATKVALQRPIDTSLYFIQLISLYWNIQSLMTIVLIVMLISAGIIMDELIF